MKKPKQETIPTHRMDFQSTFGIQLNHLEITEERMKNILESHKNEVHRDEYYIFLLIESGAAKFTLDFEEVQLHEHSVFYVRPGQVHFPSLVKDIKGWFLAIDTMLINNDYKALFEEQFSIQQCICINPVTLKAIGETALLLKSALDSEKHFSNNIALNLSNVFIGIIAQQYATQQQNLLSSKSKTESIAHQFKKALSANFLTTKSPSQYAQLLNYSLSHLNQSVKTATGFSVSYWIHQQIMLEAKRLLYYTNMDIKEIAYKLGYEDHTYFSRLFSKTVGLSPRAFRQKIRE